jgi:hypothetical protein
MMKKIYLFAFIVISGILQSNNAVSQCTPAFSWAGYLTWTEPAIAPTPYTGFLCQGHDSIFTRPGWAYFDGDGYEIHLIAGSQVTIRLDSCATTATSSITICDSNATGPGLGNIIAGAYSAAACPNSLNFTAPYTGTYFIVYDTDNNCANTGSSAMGTSSVKLNNAASITNCNPLQPVNDTICAAINIPLATLISGNTAYADPTDPLDAAVLAAGYTCGPPNNSIWYTFTPPNNGNYDFNTTSPALIGLDIWIGLFTGTNCTSPLTYVDCLLGASPGGTWSEPYQNLIGGQLYYIMIEGFNQTAGPFTLEIVANTTGINENATLASQVKVYPNPAKGLLNIASNMKSKDVTFTIYNSIGQDMYSAELNNNLTTQVDVSFLANGIYMIQFKSNDGIFTKKIAVQNQN